MDNSDVITLSIEEIYFDEDIYPRLTKSQTTEEAYKESLEAGATFPPIEVQYVNIDGEREILLLDGYNRWKAHGKAGRDTIEAVFWRDEILDKDKNFTELLLRAAWLNSRHGKRLEESDKKSVARTVREIDPKISQQNIADALGVSQQTVSNYVRDIEARQNAEEQADIYRLNALGWTQEEIGDAIELAQSTISERLSDLPNLVKLIKSLLERGESVSDVAEKLKIDLTLAWALALEGLDERARLEKLSEDIKGLKCEPRPYDVWNFTECCDLMGYQYNGRIPGQIVQQLLFFFTEPGALVIDPMAGSGTVVDACLLMKRKCFAFDNSPESFEKRVDIREGEALETIQSLKRKPDLIFLDSPYFKKLENEYGSESISALPRDEYLNFFSEFAGRSYESGAKRVALLMSDYTDDEDPNLHIFIWDYVERFKAKKWIVERHIMAPIPNQVVHADFIEKFRKSKKLARLGRSLVIFRRP